MINRLLIIGLSIGLYITMSAQVKPQKDVNAPEIVFSKTVHSFGELAQYAPASCEFKFYNKGKAPLIISDVITSCGCTVPSWPKAPIMAGDSGLIHVIYSTAETGAINKQITVFSNATKKPLSLKLDGKVIKNKF